MSKGAKSPSERSRYGFGDFLADLGCGCLIEGLFAVSLVVLAGNLVLK